MNNICFTIVAAFAMRDTRPLKDFRSHRCGLRRMVDAGAVSIEAGQVRIDRVKLRQLLEAGV